ncbi:uncharacterized protein TNCV_881991 [Trichonephila clavipes]|nr:uncharacterized protein TNCV_881991 [Trichonephila clavipes]
MSNCLGIKKEEIKTPVSGINGLSQNTKWKLKTIISNEDSSFAEPVDFLIVDKITEFTPSSSLDISKVEIPNFLTGFGIRDDPVLHERDQAIEIFKETVEFEKGRYIMQLPFRKSYNELSDNYPLAKQRFQNLWRRFGHDTELYQEYREIIRDYTEQGIIEEVKTEITDNMLKRPYIIYLIRPLHIEKYKHEFPHTVELLDRNFYVDDLISGGNEFEEALQTSRRAKNIMEAAGIDLRKWIINDANLMEQWKKENFNVHPVHETVSLGANGTKVLGLSWNTNEDYLTTDTKSLLEFVSLDKNTKRFILQAVGKTFDPLGLISPFTVRMKCLLQDLWKEEIQSDDPLPTHTEKEWKKWSSGSCELDYLTEHEKETVVQERKKLPEADKSEETVLLNSDSSSILDELLELSNNYFKVINILSYIFRFNYNCRNKSKKVGPLTVAEFKESEIKLIKHAQRSLFDKKEIPSSISNLFPFVDGERIVRVDGILENASVPYLHKHPAILPKGSKLTKLYFNSLHTRLFHVGPQGLLNAVEGILNSRPLTPLSSDVDNFDVLAPGHFLIGRPITSIPESNLIDVNENHLSRWEKIIKCGDSFERQDLKNARNKLWPDQEGDKNFSDNHREEITDFVQSIPRFQECDKEDVETWMACDAEDCGFQMLNDDEIVTSMQEESNPVDDETDEDEDNNNDESSKGPSNADAFSALDTAMKWYEQQSECCPTQLLLLKRVRDLAAKK